VEFSNNKQNCSQQHESQKIIYLFMVNFMKYVASEEQKRRVGHRGQERKQQKQKKKVSFVSGTVKMPIGSNVTIKVRVLNRLSKNDSVLHRVSSFGRECCSFPLSYQ
jgi:hypothetical protein